MYELFFKNSFWENTEIIKKSTEFGKFPNMHEKMFKNLLIHFNMKKTYQFSTEMGNSTICLNCFSKTRFVKTQKSSRNPHSLENVQKINFGQAQKNDMYLYSS